MFFHTNCADFLCQQRNRHERSNGTRDVLDRAIDYATYKLELRFPCLRSRLCRTCISLSTNSLVSLASIRHSTSWTLTRKPLSDTSDRRERLIDDMQNAGGGVTSIHSLGSTGRYRLVPHMYTSTTLVRPTVLVSTGGVRATR